MRGFVDKIEAWDNSSLIFKFHIKVSGKCVGVSLLCDQISKNDKCYVVYAGFNAFRIVEVEYNDYFIFHVINYNKLKTFKMMGLYARKPDVDEKLKERFGELCQKYGIPEENILDLTDDGTCIYLWSSLPKSPCY
ncbi:lipocalin Can f 6.0101-like [Molossus molossus]|uniref:lipocalin Can f 6.0101-like n=1 Tax=Molossus molossus TaxID=27622 RepID=UPI001747C0BB|nr:lipocalin Can f 6.0101-like [Molossus molossus]